MAGIHMRLALVKVLLVLGKPSPQGLDLGGGPLDSELTDQSRLDELPGAVDIQEGDTSMLEQ